MIRPRKPIDANLAREVRRTRAAYEVSHLEYLRAVKSALKVMSQGEVAKQLGVTQPAISQLQPSLQKVQEVPDGKVCADASEACLRYAAGLLTTPALVRLLQEFRLEGQPVAEVLQRSEEKNLLEPSKANRVRTQLGL